MILKNSITLSNGQFVSRGATLTKDQEAIFKADMEKRNKPSKDAK